MASKQKEIEFTYPISMNRGDLSKLSKEQLIKMLLNPAVSAIKAGPVARQTASVNKTGPVFKPKSLVQLAAEKIEQSTKKPAVLPKQNNQLSTTLAAHALVKDKINYWEKKANENSSIITLDKKPIDIADMREDEMAKSRILQNAPGSTI